jgi:GTP-binding protein
VLADIPGLIEGASQGTGLGMDFLRHIQRTRVLVHVLDGLSADPLADFNQVNAELALFDPNLAKKPQIVALNKMDQPEVQELLPKLKKTLKKRGYEVMGISAMARTDVRELLFKAYHKLAETPVLAETEAPTLPVYRPKEDIRQFVITREGSSTWRVSGSGIERAAEMTYFEHRGSLRRFQKLLETLGVEAELRKAGVQDGHTVHIGDFELEWQD